MYLDLYLHLDCYSQNIAVIITASFFEVSLIISLGIFSLNENNQLS